MTAGAREPRRAVDKRGRDLQRFPAPRPEVPDLAGKVIVIARIDYGLFLWTEDNWEILLAGPVTVTGSGPAAATIDVDVPGVPLPHELAGLVGSTITRLVVGEDGRLDLHLGDRRLSVETDPDYESWQLSGHRGEMWICTPGGGLTHFPPLPDPDAMS